jgi:hypothetical protein
MNYLKNNYHINRYGFNVSSRSIILTENRFKEMLELLIKWKKSGFTNFI